MISGFNLTEEHRMLIRIRDTLYEGAWDDFETDLHARAGGRPHVFDIVPPSQNARSAIERHLNLIRQMREWERDTGQVFHVEEPTQPDPG